MGRPDAGLEYGTLDVAGVRRGYRLARVIGPIPRHLDATGILLEIVTGGL